MLSPEAIKNRIAEYRRKQKYHEENNRFDTAAVYKIMAELLEDILEGESESADM